MRQYRVRMVVRALSTLGVIASLLLLAREVQQNTMAVRGATYQAIADASIDHTTWFASHEHLPSLVAQVSEGAVTSDFTLEEQVLLRALYITTVRRMENIFVQVEEGLVGEEAIERFRPSESFFDNAYFGEYWVSGDVRFEPRFKEFFEENFAIGAPPAPN